MCLYNNCNVCNINQMSRNAIAKMHEQTLLDRGVPLELAKKAAAILAKDNPNHPMLGRTKSEQKVIVQLTQYVNQQAK